MCYFKRCFCTYKLFVSLQFILQKPLAFLPTVKKKKMNKKKRIELRCSSLEKAIIQKKAKKTGLTISEFCRASALGQKISSKFSDEEIEIFQMLTKYHNNFISLSNLFKTKNPSLSNETKILATEIKNILLKLQ